MRRIEASAVSLKKVKEETFLLSFKSSYIAQKASPGQFLHLRIDPLRLLLRRPLSIHRIEGQKIDILFRLRGKGTRKLSLTKKGDTLDILGPLGRGFNYTDKNIQGKVKILVAGGMGVAPLFFLAQKLTAYRDVLVLLGAATKKEILCKKDFQKLGCKVLIATEDGSLGFKGRVTVLLKHLLTTQYSALSTVIYACGPTEMLFSLRPILKTAPRAVCQVSFEQFMGCGIGVCRACVIKTAKGYRRICKEGPVFDIKDIS
ncbi:MAG: dihydroorotate dehydrogenase electron transfer subunit [Candidatus Omnitrophica bacterium]|nr:dihydroorotate dehydrogenase electron transfer subunit [Candidatus Omnitrophota bacterium]